MKYTHGRTRRPREIAPEDASGEASRSFKAVQLRLLMKEREGLFQSLVKLDIEIWSLEEFFRADS